MKQQRAYNRLKSDHEDDLVLKLRAAGLRPRALFGKRLRITCTWHEPDRRRDPDNVVAGGKKLLLDALSRRGAFIHCDGHHCIEGFGGDAFAFPDQDHYRKPGGLQFWIAWGQPGGDEGGVSLWLPGRLPALNELLAAREAGVRRELWRRAQGERGGQA